MQVYGRFWFQNLLQTFALLVTRCSVLPVAPPRTNGHAQLEAWRPSLLLSSNALFRNGNPKKLLQTQNCEKTLITSWPNKLVVAHDCWNQKVVLLVVCELEAGHAWFKQGFPHEKTKFRVSISKRETCVFPDGPKRTIATKPPVIALPLRLMLASGVLPSFCSPATTSLQPTVYRTKSRRDTSLFRTFTATTTHNSHSQSQIHKLAISQVATHYHKLTIKQLANLTTLYLTAHTSHSP